MLLQGAAIVRFVNTLQVFRQAKNFVLCGIFIWDGGSATRYDLFQDDNEVCCFLYVGNFIGSAITGLLRKEGIHFK